jgi:hypothetical protein
LQREQFPNLSLKYCCADLGWTAFSLDVTMAQQNNILMEF